MILIKDYSDKVKKSFATTKSQGRFMREVFRAAGYDRFPNRSDEEYAKKICNGTKPITDNMIEGFQRPYRIVDLAEYFERNIDIRKKTILANAFGISDKSVDIGNLSKALAAQFFGLVEVGGGTKSADDIVDATYRKLKDGVASNDIISVPHHSGDRAWIANGQRSRHYTKEFYEKFEHVWLIRNDGRVPWNNRRLICTTKQSQSIKIDVYEVDVPDTNPGETAEISMTVDARGNEGSFTSIWIMEDAMGNNCFPNERWLFEFTVTVTNKSRESTEA